MSGIEIKNPSVWKPIIKLRIFSVNLLIFSIYLIAGKLGLSLATVNASTTAIWPPTGIALASLLIFGNKVLPAIFAGAFFVNLSTTGNYGTSLGIALGNSLEAVVGAYLVKKFSKGTYAFNEILNIIKFTFFAGMVSTALSASIGVITLILGNQASVHDFWPVWLTWWLGDMGGALVITPFVLVLVNNFSLSLNVKKSLHFLAAFFCLLVVSGVVLSGFLPFPYLCLPIAVWIAFWFGQRGAALSTILVATIAILYTLSGQGPFVKTSLINQPLLLLQLFVNVYSLTGLTFAAVVLEMKNSQRMLEYNEKRFQSLIENSSDGVVLIDTTSLILYASPSVKRILGYDPEELIGKTGFDLVDPQDRPKTMEALSNLVTQPGGHVTVQYRTIKKSGKVIWVEATGTNLLLEPAVHAVVVNYHDITEQKTAHEKLLEEKLEDEAMLSSIGEGIIAIDSQGVITMVNKAACQLLGWEEKALVGKSVTEAITMQDDNNQDIPPSNRPIYEVLNKGKRYTSSTFNYYLRKDRTKLPVRMTISPILLNKQLIGAIEVFHDITKNLELERSKDEFISVASHELRTPITAINGLLSMILKGVYGPVNAKLKRPLENTYLSAKRQIHLINDLLDVSRLQTGKISFQLENLSLRAEIDEVIKSLQPLAQEKGIYIKCIDSSPIFVQADKEWIKRVLSNLIGNALKFTKEGGVSISLFKKQGQVYINITDTGVGIDPNDFGKLFKQFQQVRMSNQLDKPTGSGLGLYLSKQVAQVMGGDVLLKTSHPGKGSVFTFILPAQDSSIAKKIKLQLQEKANQDLSQPLIS